MAKVAVLKPVALLECINWRPIPLRVVSIVLVQYTVALVSKPIHCEWKGAEVAELLEEPGSDAHCGQADPGQEVRDQVEVTREVRCLD